MAEPEGTWVVPGSFEVDRLRELVEESSGARGCWARVWGMMRMKPRRMEEHEPEQTLAQLLTKYEATTVGGLVSEMAGHIPLPGEVVEDGPLRLEVIASTDRLVERVRVGLMGSSAGNDGRECRKQEIGSRK